MDKNYNLMEERKKKKKKPGMKTKLIKKLIGRNLETNPNSCVHYRKNNNN